MYVYLIEALGTGLVKIGYSRNPKLRLADLIGGSAAWLKLVGYFNGTLEDERELHRQFHDLREHHEWFRDDESIRKAFATHPSWQPRRAHACASEGFLKLPQEPAPAPAAPQDGAFQKTQLHVVTQRIIARWLDG